MMPSKDKTSTEKFWIDAQVVLHSLQMRKLAYSMCNLCIFIKYLFVNKFHTILNFSSLSWPDEEELRGRARRVKLDKWALK